MRWIHTITPMVVACLAGCSSGDANDSAPLVPVSGTITLNGKPMADAKVTFLPVGGNTYQTPGLDLTGSDGNYKLRFKGRFGISAGKYKVSVEPSLVTDTDKMPDAFKKDPFMWQKSLDAKQSAGKTGSTKSPAGAKSEFDAEIPENGGVFDFDVKKSSTSTPAPAK